MKPKTTADKPLPAAVTSDVACGYLSVSNSTLKRLEKAGLLTPIRISRRKTYPIPALDALMREGLTRLLLTPRK